jgi:hypothetical protein
MILGGVGVAHTTQNHYMNTIIKLCLFFSTELNGLKWRFCQDRRLSAVNRDRSTIKRLGAAQQRRLEAY